MAKSQRQIVYERAEEYAQKHTLQKVTVKMGPYMGNKQCGHNSRQWVEEGRATHVVATLAFIPKSGVIVHIMPVVDGEVVDNTLGYLSKYNTYYVIGQYFREDMEKIHINKLIDQLKEEWLSKLFSKKEREELGILLDHI